MITHQQCSDGSPCTSCACADGKCQRDYKTPAITEDGTLTPSPYSQETWDLARKLAYLIEWMRHTPGLRTELSLDGTDQHNLTVWEEFIRTHPDKRDWGSFAIVEFD